MWTIRAYRSGDRHDLRALADRLAVGRPSWRDHDRWSRAVRGWVEASIAAADEDGHALLVAERGTDSRLAGFVSVGSRTHFTGDVDAYVGELAVAAWAEGRGAGRALLDAAEAWAAAHGYARLTLETGAANQRALDFYRRAGYLREDVRLTKLLD